MGETYFFINIHTGMCALIVDIKLVLPPILAIKRTGGGARSMLVYIDLVYSPFLSNKLDRRRRGMVPSHLLTKIIVTAHARLQVVLSRRQQRVCRLVEKNRPRRCRRG